MTLTWPIRPQRGDEAPMPGHLQQLGSHREIAWRKSAREEDGSP